MEPSTWDSKDMSELGLDIGSDVAVGMGDGVIVSVAVAKKDGTNPLV
jgi:hypothetical protein